VPRFYPDLMPDRQAPPAHPRTLMDFALEWLATRQRFSIVQVGAYIGNTVNDPLHAFLVRELPRKPQSTVVLVEPVREYFARLEGVYSGLPGIRLENVAIADREGERDFYRLGADPAVHGHPEWLSQLGSLRPTRMTEMWDRYEQGLMDQLGETADLKAWWLEHRVIESVQCITLHQLLDRHDLAELDLLQIDAEGYDYEILRTIDFTRIRPRFVNYERVLLHHDEAACRALMVSAGYVLFDFDQDTLCVALS
jgi:FkbM family methyltransferase